MHHCPVQGCGQRNPRDDKVRSHMHQSHQLLFPDAITSRRLFPVLPTSIFRNRQFRDPGTAAPPVEIGAVRPPVAREVQRIQTPRVALAGVENIQQDHTPVYKISLKRTASPTRRISAEYQPTKKISKPNVINNTVLENCDVKSADRATLLQEHAANQRILDKLGKRQKLICDELKRREETERAAMKRQMVILQQQLKM